MCALFIYIYFYLKQLFIFSSDNHLIYEYVMSVLYDPVPPLIILMIFTSFDIYKVNPKFRFSQHLYTISSPLVLTSPPSLLLLLYYPSSPFFISKSPSLFRFLYFSCRKSRYYTLDVQWKRPKQAVRMTANDDRKGTEQKKKKIKESTDIIKTDYRS